MSSRGLSDGRTDCPNCAQPRMLCAHQTPRVQNYCTKSLDFIIYLKFFIGNACHFFGLFFCIFFLVHCFVNSFKRFLDQKMALKFHHTEAIVFRYALFFPRIGRKITAFLPFQLFLNFHTKQKFCLLFDS